MKNYPPLHTDTLARANRLANRAARNYPEATRNAVLAIRDEFLERLQERIAKRGNTFQPLKSGN